VPGVGSRAYSKLDQIGQTRRARKQARVTADTRAERACYRHVDARDGDACRICRRWIGARAIHHHMIPRSRISVARGRHSFSNVIRICTDPCDEAIHRTATLHVEGDAEQRGGVEVWVRDSNDWRLDRHC
jgi:hypothetical protein